jgi:DNA-directed RNA polymerase specialized sigma24 family protein
MQTFLTDHQALILRNARAHVNNLSPAERLPAEDIAREVHLIFEGMVKSVGLKPETIDDPDGYIRDIVPHAARRARRRKMLIEQISAGDDLVAIREELSTLDSDLPRLPSPRSDQANDARRHLDALKEALPPRDALIAALLFEDDLGTDDACFALGMDPSTIQDASARILAQALRIAKEGSEESHSRHGDAPHDPIDQLVRHWGRIAASARPRQGAHVDEPDVSAFASFANKSGQLAANCGSLDSF